MTLLEYPEEPLPLPASLADRVLRHFALEIGQLIHEEMYRVAKSIHSDPFGAPFWARNEAIITTWREIASMAYDVLSLKILDENY
jgi:hypothetical protein